METIAQRFAKLAIHAPNDLAYVAEDLQLSRQNLLRIVYSYAHRFSEYGVAKGEFVSIKTSDAVVSIASVLALSLVGAVYVPYGEELPKSAIAAKIKHSFRSSELTATAEKIDIEIDHSWSPLHPQGNDTPIEPLADQKPNDLCWLLPSSGTTGTPKFVSIDTALLNKRIGAIAEDYSGNPTRLLLLFAASSRPFIIRAIAALCFGHVLIDTRSIDFAVTQDVTFVCASPQQISQWLGRRSLSQRLPVVQVSGAKISVELVEKLLESFERVDDVYGANETIKAHINRYSKSGKTHRCVGLSAVGAVKILDSDGRPCPEGKIGHVWTRTGQMVHEYFTDARASADHFVDGWFKTGDLGKLTADRVLDISGRASEIINIGGQKIALSELEMALAMPNSVVAASCFENTSKLINARLVGCLELAQGANIAESMEEAWLECARQYGPLVAPQSLLAVANLSKTEDGVPIRRHAQEQFAASIFLSDRAELQRTLINFEVRDDD